MQELTIGMASLSPLSCHVTKIIPPYKLRMNGFDYRGLQKKYESGVSPVSKRYMRAGIGKDRLVVCLSEYLP